MKVKILLLLSTYFVSQNCFAQLPNLKTSLTRERCYVGIWIPDQTDEAYKFKYTDTTSDECHLIFERSFNDSVQIFIDSLKIFEGFLKTNGITSVVEESISLKIPENKQFCLTIFLPLKGKYTTFSHQNGFLVAYINRLNTSWNIQYSNFPRFYY